MRSTIVSSFRSGGPIRAGLSFMLLLVLAGAQPGCALFSSSNSFSESSGSVSDSIGSSSDSSGSSSGGDDGAYREDLRSYTLVAVGAGESPEALRRGVTEIALARGISDWEAVESSWLGIGDGLAAADLTAGQRAAYRAALAPPGSPADRSLRSPAERQGATRR